MKCGRHIAIQCNGAINVTSANEAIGNANGANVTLPAPEDLRLECQCTEENVERDRRRPVNVTNGFIFTIVAIVIIGVIVNIASYHCTCIIIVSNGSLLSTMLLALSPSWLQFTIGSINFRWIF